MLNSSLETNLIYLRSNFEFIPSEITQLDTSEILLLKLIKCIKRIKSLIQKAQNKFRQTIGTKTENIILKNDGFQILTNISEMLDGKGSKRENLTTDDMTYFKCASITFVNTERSFSPYKHLLTDQHHSLLFENIRYILIVQCNSAT